ncbi:MAG: hypothetical protein WCJ56_02840 [bacterium]
MEKNVSIESKEEWVTPQLICMGRSNPEETAVLACNEDGLGGLFNVTS